MNQLQKRRNRKGFTLIELIVVIAILAILAAIAIPAFSGQLERARNRSHDANVAVLRSAANVALAEHGSPTANVTWSALGGGEDPYLAADYLDTWPENPSKSGTYTVTIGADGSVTVAPDTGVYGS